MNLNQITIPSRDVPRSIQFYQKLGLKLIVHTHDQYARFESPEGDATFSIHYAKNVPKEGIWIYFEVNDVAETVTDLKRKGITFDSEITDQSWLWTEIILKDPDGNQLRIYHAGEHRKNPPWRLKNT